MILKGYLFSVLYALICLALAFLLFKVGVAKKITRKFVHILVGFEWVILYHFFGAGLHFLVVCLLFLCILAFSYRKNLMPMISSDGDNSPGTVYYALAMSFMAMITLIVPDMILPFGIGVFCTSLGDGFAGLLGQLMDSPRNTKIYGNKTVYGTLFNLIVCFIVTGVISAHFNLGLQTWHILAIAFFATELELVTGRGLDNITVTLGASLLSYLFINRFDASEYIVPILLTPLIIAFVYKKHALTIGGIIAAVIVDILISISLGNPGFIILLTFLVGGILTDKIKKRYKNLRQNKKEGTECRNHVQVLANSTVATACAVLYFLTDEKLFVIGFISSLAEALADTAASGIGIISGQSFDLFRMRKCTPGISGGMSLLGTLSSLVAAILIGLISLAYNMITPLEMVIVIISAFLGAIFDSFLGSLAQVKFRCPICNSIVEIEEHCSTTAVKHSGIRFVNNNFVNLLGTLFSAVVSAVFYYIIIM